MDKQREAAFNRFGERIVSSSFEQIRGNQVEFYESTDSVIIEQNVPLLGLPIFTAMKNTVNIATLWGMAPRCVKLGKVSWERQILGTCSYYYTRKLEFGINSRTWDRDVPDEGDKVIDGKWIKNPTTGNWEWEIKKKPDNITEIDRSDPRNYIRAKDPHDQPFHVQLDGNGAPLKFGDPPAKIHVEKYTESNFLLLGIPTVIGI